MEFLIPKNTALIPSPTVGELTRIFTVNSPCPFSMAMATLGCDLRPLKFCIYNFSSHLEHLL